MEFDKDKIIIPKRNNSNKIFHIIKIKNKKKWTKEEDSLLINLAQKYKEKHWKEISNNFCASTANSMGNWFKTSLQ